MRHFKIGVIAKPHGIRGEIKVFPTTDNPLGFNRLVGMDVMVGDELLPFKLKSARVQKGMAYVKLDAAGDRDAAQKLVGAGIFIGEDQALPLAEDEYFERDLIGMEIRAEDGEILGQLIKILYMPANDVYVIQPPGKEAFMIPATKEVVKHVSAKEKIMTVKLLEGLDELTI